MAIQFAGHVHVHDEYSLLDGSGNRNQLTYEAVTKGQTHLAITNHGRLGGALEHVHACRHPEAYENPYEPGVKRASTERLIPTLGIEAYWRESRFMDLSDQSIYGKNGHNWAQHLCIHAGSLRGWRTLLRLNSKSWVKKEFGGGFYGKPVIDLDMIENDHEGLIFSTACISSPVAQYILAGDERGAKRWIRRMQKYGPVWLEIMPHGLPAQQAYNIGLYNIAYDLGEPLLATQDVHTPYAAWKTTQSIVRMISYRQTISKKESKKEAGEDTYTDEIDTVFLTDAKEMYQQFLDNHPDLPKAVVGEAMSNTKDFFRSFKPFTFGRSLKMPHVEVDAKKVVWKWVQEGLQQMLEEYPEEHWDEFPFESYEKRAKMEFDVICDKDAVAYFWIVGDFLRWCRSTDPLPIRIGNRLIYPKGKRKEPILVNLRGSAAGCLVSRLIGISAVDPIPHELLFERFMNPDREGMPDIDIDLESGEYGRDLAKEYFRVVYGKNHVADVIAYQTFGPRAVIRGVAETQDADFKELKEVTEAIGPTERGMEKIAAKTERVAKFKKEHPDWWEEMLRLEDQIKNDSRHASAIIITDKPVVDTGMAVQTGSDGQSIITAWSDRIEFPIVSMFGWQKFDLLGLNSLNKLKLALQLIERFYGKKVDLMKLPVMRDPRAVDKKVMRNFKDKKIWDVFQFAGAGIADALFAISPDDVNELSLANALYRPGASSQIDEFVARKRGESKYELWHEALIPYLGHTFGIIAFQEQVMQTCVAIGGFTGAQADFMRKAISKLYRLGKEEAQKEMRPFWEIWQKGCRAVGMADKMIVAIWELILEFGGYSFNKAHSTSYALQAYMDMWIKTYYPLAYYAASFTISKKDDKKEQIAFLKSGIREAASFGIEVLPPDVNKSDAEWTIEDENIRFGFSSIAEIGWAAAKAITRGQPYESYADFCLKAPGETNKKHAMALVKAGAFDSVDDREYLLGQVQQWDGNTTKWVIKFDCGCERKRTVKLTPKQIEELESRHRYQFDDPERRQAFINEQLREKANAALFTASCKDHPEAEVESIDQRFDTYTVAEWMREEPGKEPQGFVPPTAQEIALAEREALNISMTAGSPVVRYYDFIEDRIMTPEEIEDLPRQPKRKKVRGSWVHSSNCGCKECVAAEVRVGGEITRSKEINTKNGEKMAFVDLAFGADTYNLTFFPRVWTKFKELVKEPTAFLVMGHKNDRGQITVNDMFDVIEVAEDYGWEPPAISKPKRKAKAKLSTLKNGQILQLGEAGGKQIQGLVVAPNGNASGVKFNPKMKAAA